MGSMPDPAQQARILVVYFGAAAWIRSLTWDLPMPQGGQNKPTCVREGDTHLAGGELAEDHGPRANDDGPNFLTPGF